MVYFKLSGVEFRHTTSNALRIWENWGTKVSWEQSVLTLRFLSSKKQPK